MDNQELSFGHITFEMCVDIQVEMWSTWIFEPSWSSEERLGLDVRTRDHHNTDAISSYEIG